jgi:hypothetical protein
MLQSLYRKGFAVFFNNYLRILGTIGMMLLIFVFPHSDFDSRSDSIENKKDDIKKIVLT